MVSEVWTLIDLARTLGSAGPWRSWWFLSLASGFSLWLLIFVFLPRTMWLYVLGHEFTHALAAMMAGGKVTAFKVTSKGGHVMTDRVNWWIALSPYFVPIYALIWVGLWLTVDFYYPLKAWLPALFFGLGLFWCFHVTFTVSMFHLRQTDLTGQGIVFSFVIIALFNVLFVLLLFSILTHDVAMSWKLFLQRTGQCYVYTWNEILQGIAWVQKTIHDQTR